MTISITGITGNMGRAALAELTDAPHIDKIKLLCRNEKRMKKLLKKHKALKSKIELVTGDMTDNKALARLVKDSDLIINMAAVIPPRSDSDPGAAVACNEKGVDILVSILENLPEDIQPAFVHVSTVALYGNRSGAHPFGRVGDPLLVAPLDAYSATKLRGEFRVLESDIVRRAVLRQTAMLHPQMLADNIHDGLMFHTVFDAPLEWVTAHDSGVLIRNIAERYARGDMPDNFWGRVFDITGGKANRSYGITAFDDGFSVMGGKTKDFFRPYYNATRNFHGVWYLDGDELNDMFGYRSQTTEDYWQEVFAAHPVFKLGRFVPKRLIGFSVFKRLLKDKNAPSYWAKHGDEARLIAYFGGRDEYEALKKRSWNDFPMPDGDGIKNITDNETPVFYGFDPDKRDAELTQADLESVAAAHGGKLLSKFNGDMYEKLDWQTQDGEIFAARPYTVMRAGHWYNKVYDKFVWEFDRLAKKDKIYASIWYDTHGKDENYTYLLDARYNAVARKDDIR